VFSIVAVPASISIFERVSNTIRRVIGVSITNSACLAYFLSVDTLIDL